MTKAVAVADRIHTLAADPSKGLGNFLADVERLRVQHGDDVVIAALATELMTTSARLASQGTSGGNAPA